MTKYEIKIKKKVISVSDIFSIIINHQNKNYNNNKISVLLFLVFNLVNFML